MKNMYDIREGKREFQGRWKIVPLFYCRWIRWVQISRCLASDLRKVTVINLHTPYIHYIRCDLTVPIPNTLCSMYINQLALIFQSSSQVNIHNKLHICLFFNFNDTYPIVTSLTL